MEVEFGNRGKAIHCSIALLFGERLEVLIAIIAEICIIYATATSTAPVQTAADVQVWA